MGNRLRGKIAIVTGGASGIGEATSRLFASEGATVVIGDVQERRGAEVADAIRADGGQATFMPLDVTVEAQVQGIIDATLERHRRLDVLFNNAGVENPQAEVDTSQEEWDRVMNTNVRGVFFGTKHAVPAMKQGGGGSIINSASAFAIVGHPGFAAYHASKGGVRFLTKSTALTHARDKIRCNCICPGAIETPMLTGLIEAAPDPVATRAAWEQLEPVGRLGTPLEVAYAVLFLASDEASFVTATELIVDGGYTSQ